MKIGIDARFYGPIGRGLGRYTQEVVDRIIEKSKSSQELDLSFVIFLSPENFDEFRVNGANVIKVKLNFRWYSLAEQIFFPYYIKKYKLDLIHFPHFNIPIFCPIKFIVTIHDLILTRFPTLRATTKNSLIYFLKNLAYRLVLYFAVKRSSKIISVSEFTKKDILSLFKINPEKIEVIYEGATDLKSGKDNLFLEKNKKSLEADKKSLEERSLTLDNLNLPAKFLLYVGSAYPHKNLEKLLGVIKKLRISGDDISLVLVGKNDFFYERLKKEAKELVEDKSVIFTGYLSDYELSVLYSKALAFIFPSLYEGFGLPPLEAMANSCPVISSNHSCMSEILGDSALYFNPEDDDEIIEKIKIIDNDTDLRKELIEKGLRQVEKYSWNLCASSTLDLYLEALNLKQKTKI